jgi:type VI secretion system secreted protein VgrG
MQLSLHYRSSFNGNYLITEVEHGGSQAGVLLSGVNTPFNTDKAGTFYECKFKAIPSAKQFRPERVTPKPKILGTLTATIDDEGSGTYAQVNEYGQYKVELMYDLSDKPTNKGSAWVRMATPYAGPRNGMHFPLLKGTEVLLGFMSGDPDQPVILGAVTNSENPNVVSDQNATFNGFVTAGANMLSANDRAGKESMHFYSPQGGTSIIIGSFES